MEGVQLQRFHFVPDDGFTVRATVPETEYYPAIERVEFRPMVGSPRTETEQKWRGAVRSDSSGAALFRLMAAVVADRVTGWSLEPAPTLETVRTLEPNLLEYLFSVVMRLLPAVVLPEDGEAEKGDDGYLQRVLGEETGHDTVGDDLGN